MWKHDVLHFLTYQSLKLLYGKNTAKNRLARTIAAATFSSFKLEFTPKIIDNCCYQLAYLPNVQRFSICIAILPRRFRHAAALKLCARVEVEKGQENILSLTRLVNGSAHKRAAAAAAAA